MEVTETTITQKVVCCSKEEKQCTNRMTYSISSWHSRAEIAIGGDYEK